MRRARKGFLLLGLTGVLTGMLVGSWTVVAQVWENPEDPMGILIPYPFVHLVHAHTLPLEGPLKGTSADLRANDPFLFYQLGRDLLQREFRLSHGLYGQAGALNIPLYATAADLVHGAPARFARDHSASCGTCHSMPFKEPSAGQTIASTGGMGRNTPHFFGAGLVEMIGQQVEAMVLQQYDRDQDRLISRDEVSKPCPVRIRPVAGAEPIDFGDLSPGPDGVPRLNPAFRIWYVDSRGKVLKDASSLKDPRAAAFGFAFQPFGWGRGRRTFRGVRVAQGGEASTVREFYTDAADFHMGLQAYDPTQQGSDPEATGFGGLAKVSLNGAQQYDFGGSVDPGHKLSPTGLSLDDPDRDRSINELTEGDVDAVEFYLLHTPPPATRATATSEAGRAVLLATGCTRCHVESWQLEPRDEKRGFTGDRRLFRLETTSRSSEDGLPELIGQLVRSDRVSSSGEHVPAYQGYKVERVYSDFKQWDIGPEFFERRFDGSLQREHRTTPLWGVGTTAPYGHDGHLMTLDGVIRAHAGAAGREARAYRDLTPGARESLLAYLKSLVLYQTDVIPADVDGDGKIADDFTVLGQAVDYERFDARFLFLHPPRYRNVGAYVRYDRREMPLLLIDNIPEAYGLALTGRVDMRGDGFPDVIRSGTGELPAATTPEAAEELWQAAKQNDAAKVADLLARGVDPNVSFREQGTALLFAAQRGHLAVVKVLLEHGADVQSTETVNRVSALHFSIGYPQVVKVLLDRGADVNTQEMLYGQSPLGWAVLRNDSASAKMLLESGRMSRLALEKAADLARREGRAEFASAIAGVLAETAEVVGWPQFRGEGASGVADGQHLPPQFGLTPPTHLKWQVTIPGLAHSSPIVWGDRVFVTTAVSSQLETDFQVTPPTSVAKDMSSHSLRVLCFDRLSGKLLWERTAYSGVPKSKRSPRNSYASSTPATDGRYVVALFGAHGLYCYDLDGKLLWTQDLGSIDQGFFFDPEYQWGDASSPILYKNLVIVQCDQQKDSFLAAFDLATGERRWRAARDELPAWSTPTLVRTGGLTAVVVNGVNAIRAYDPDTGNLRWTLKTGNSMIAATTPVAGQGLVVVANGYRPLKPIYAIHPEGTGDISLGDAEANRWVQWSKKSGAAYYITPIIYGDYLYVLAEGGVLTSYYLKTGEPIYRQRVGDAGDVFSSSPVASDGFLYLASEGGSVYVIKAGLEYQLTSTHSVGEPCMATPAIAGHMLFVRTRHQLLAFG